MVPRACYEVVCAKAGRVNRASVTVDWLFAEDPRWSEALLQLRHDVYHLPQYSQFTAAYEGARAAALYVGRQGECIFLAPVILRELPLTLGAPHEWCDLISPYGYASPLLSATVDRDAQQGAMRAVREFACAHHVVSGFFRLHPLLPVPLAVFEAEGRLVLHGPTVWIDLTASADELFAQLRENHRRDVKRLRRDGFWSSMDQWVEYDAFVSAYRETMRRVAADDDYQHDAAYFRDLRSALGDSLHLCTVRDGTGRFAASGLFSEYRGVVQYLFSGTADGFVQRAPTKLMFQSLIEWARGRGCRVMHLGGGVGGREDSLFRFKAGFSNLRGEFRTFRLIPDQARYDRLARDWSTETGTGATLSFFPHYRAAGASRHVS